MFHHIPPAFHPVFLNVICLIACLGTYFQAKEEHNGQIKDGNIPFISDLGKEKIAGALFSLFFSFYIFIAFNVITIRFEQVKSKYRFNDGRCLQVANVGIYGTGLMACTGQWMFTNFKEEKGDMLMLNAHMAGKWIAYSMSFLYVLMQSLLSAFWKEVEGRSLLVIIIRAFFSALHLALLIAYIALQENYMKTMFNQNNINDNDAAVIDWILILIPSLFTLTFIPEFYKFKTKFKIEYKDGGAIYGTFSQGDATYLGQIPGRGSIEEPSTSLISAAENQVRDSEDTNNDNRNCMSFNEYQTDETENLIT